MSVSNYHKFVLCSSELQCALCSRSVNHLTANVATRLKKAPRNELDETSMHLLEVGEQGY